ncbi:hypothetical protein FISHEDRAFT_64931 [Fistulina hepatica ATCC 64428]|uniref:N-acetyl-D-glucosamine kinase n=1 Tax=Fistulina hepatica ATCC 64428 TaxID=1128425 RepID=A0A0D7AHH9_9AGAR|nr:hypothetical protein FISHEDRAFT_64931 [Fistulina hepatica ATCC 64428]
MSLYLCVDCGGSKTCAVVTDVSGHVVARALGGPSNYAYLTLSAFTAAIKQAVSDALKTCNEASISPRTYDTDLPLRSNSPFVAAWFGVSGVDSPGAIESVTPVLAGLLGLPIGPRITVTNDTHLLAAPLRMYADAMNAVTVIGGTGSITVSFRDHHGIFEELGRIGGWGWILGDEGGGYYIGREAATLKSVRCILREHDEASVTSKPATYSLLTARILETFGATNVLEILTKIHQPDPSASELPSRDTPAYLLVNREARLSSLAPIVFECAFKHHDALALRVLQASSRALVSQVALLLGDPSASSRRVRPEDSVLVFGGSIVGIEAYRKMILADLEALGHVFRYVEVVSDPAVVGAVTLAMTARRVNGASVMNGINGVNGRHK